MAALAIKLCNIAIFQISTSLATRPADFTEDYFFSVHSALKR